MDDQGDDSGLPTFGERLPGIAYRDRAAAYVVIVEGDAVAAVKGRRGYFLPGGGSLDGETPEQTVLRETREELALGVYLTRALGVAQQLFVAEGEGGYQMRAVFFMGAFAPEPATGAGEHELFWLPVAGVDDAFFHACHTWAVRRALSMNENGNDNEDYC